MIKVSLLSGHQVVLNAELIESIESTPDTIVTLTSGKRIMVKESVDSLVDQVIHYRKATRGFTIWQRQRVPDPGISSVIGATEVVRDMSEDITMAPEEEEGDEVAILADEDGASDEEVEEGEG